MNKELKQASGVKQTPGAFNRANTVTTISMNIPLPWFFSLPVVFLSVGPPAPPAVFPPRYSFDVSELTAHPVQVPPAATVSDACSASNKQFALRKSNALHKGSQIKKG